MQRNNYTIKLVKTKSDSDTGLVSVSSKRPYNIIPVGTSLDEVDSTANTWFNQILMMLSRNINHFYMASYLTGVTMFQADEPDLDVAYWLIEWVQIDKLGRE